MTKCGRLAVAGKIWEELDSDFQIVMEVSGLLLARWQAALETSRLLCTC